MMSTFNWTKQKTYAAWLLGTSTYRVPEIADLVGVTPETVRRWRKEPDFQARVYEHEQEELEDAQRRLYARKSGRIIALDEEIQAIDKIYAARALDFETTGDGKHTGGETGRVVRKRKAIGGGEWTEFITEYEVDTGTMKERRELLKQLAQEMGQWVDKGEIVGEGMGGNISIVFEEREDGPG